MALDFFGNESPPDTLPLQPAEKKLQSVLEPTVQSGLGTALQVVVALRVLRNKRLFRTQSATFQRYLSQKFGLGPQQVCEALSAISMIENLLLDIFPVLPNSTPDLTEYETYPLRTPPGRPRSTQVAPYRRMGRPPGHA